MKVKYLEKIDREIFQEVNKMGRQLSPVFDFQFSKVKFDKRVVPIAKTIARIAPTFIDEKKVEIMMKEMYGKNIPEITIYINTTPFSTWNTRERWICISIEKMPSGFFQAVCHEINHFMYDYTFKTKKYENTEIKETITVLNNIFGIEDKGWRVFHKKRKAVLNFYMKTKNFKKAIEYAKTV